MDLADLIRREEAKRDQAWDPQEREQALRAMWDWAECNLKEPRNTPAFCARHQRELLAALTVQTAPFQS